MFKCRAFFNSNMFFKAGFFFSLLLLAVCLDLDFRYVMTRAQGLRFQRLKSPADMLKFETCGIIENDMCDCYSVLLTDRSTNFRKP